MSTRNSRVTKVGTVVAAAVLGGVGSVAVLGGTAEAVPGAQERCTSTGKSIATEDGWKSLGLGVTIDNGKVARKVIAQLAADIGVDTVAEVRVGYSIDGGPVREGVYGPANLANHTEFWQTRSTIAVIPLKRGLHKVTPYWRISGGAGKQGHFGAGCFTVEGRTR
jgi:hypothetical protein